MLHLLLLGVPPAPPTLPTLATGFTSIEPWLLIGTGVAVGWVWGRYRRLDEGEPTHGAGEHGGRG